jgi:IS4 transposase
MKEMSLTSIKTGEKIQNFKKLGKGDVVMGDRAYGTRAGIEYAKKKGCDFVLRLRSNAFSLYNEQGEKIEITDYLEKLGEGEYFDKEVYYKINNDKELQALRVCVIRKDKESEKAGEKRLKKENQRKRKGKAVSKRQSLYNKYIIVATSLGKEATASQILELYRLRWQIEIAFKRLKSLFEYGQVPSKLDKSARVVLREISSCRSERNTGKRGTFFRVRRANN